MRTSLRWRAALSIGVVAALCVVLFTTNARLAAGSAERHPQDLPGLVGSQSQRVNLLADQVDGLRAQVDALSSEVNAADGAAPAPATAGELVASAAVPVTGPALSVTLDDAPVGAPHRSDARPDDLVVHQQDLQAVMNALWAGGAEAMTLEGQRLISTSAVLCVGNVLRLHGVVYSPPYTIEAVGDPQRLRAALSRSTDVGLYLQAVAVDGLGWEVGASEATTMPAYAGATDLRYAQVPAGVDALGGGQG